jgi:ribosomal protein L12E/L44/L45/RPP1/RPP2
MTISLETLRAASSDTLLAMTKRRHPDYAASVEHWEFLELSYKGGREWIEKNLFTYHKEGKTEFAKRKQRAYRFPHSREVISLINKYVFKGSIERREEGALPAPVKDFWKSSTLLKRPIADLMNSVCTWTSTFGRIWIVVDNNVPAGVVSEADRKASGGRCYAYHLKPIDVLDLAYDDDGELNWLLNREYYRDDSDPLTAGALSSRFRLWTKNFSVPVEVKKNEDGSETATLGKPTEYDLDMVPIFPADHLDSEEPYKSNGLIDDVAYLDRAVANYLSNLDVIIQDQTFSQLAIPYQGLLPSEASGSVEDEEDGDEMRHIQQMGHNRVFVFNAEGGSAPVFLSPDVKQADIIMKAVTKIVGEIYHSIGMAGERTKEDNAAGIDNSSGVAKAYDFEKLNAMLAAKARSLQHIEKNLIRIVLAWHNQKKELQDIEEFVTYPTTFDVRNLSDEFDNAQRLSLVNAAKELRRAQMKRLAEKMFPQMEPNQMKKILDEIENDWLEVDEMALGAAAVAGNAPTLGKDRAAPKKPAAGGQKKGKQGENNKPAEKTV